MVIERGPVEERRNGSAALTVFALIRAFLIVVAHVLIPAGTPTAIKRPL